MNLPSSICSCGRAWTHCKKCGSTNFYGLDEESRIRTAMAGRPIQVFRCKKCRVPFTVEDNCLAARPSDISTVPVVTQEQVPDILRGVNQASLKSIQDAIKALEKMKLDFANALFEQGI